mmetsp:Transcript_5204/g.16711  ORF Transcript_5204/g.16711 Transcript_5204/m.16711 type:complete len:268 (+) Transcript_5204:462-1265(+)
MEERADRAAHAVDQSDACVAERDAGLRAGEHHRLARGMIVRVVARSPQVAADLGQRAERKALRERVALGAHVRLHGVARGVDPGVGREPPRHAERELVVDDGTDRQIREADAKHLLLGVRVCDDGELGGLRAGAGRAGHGNDGEPGGVHLEGRLVVAHLAAVLAENSSGFGRIHGRAAADGHDSVIAAARQLGAQLLHAVRGGVGHSVGEDAVREPVERRAHAIDCAIAAEEGVGHHEGPRHAQLAQQRAGARHHAAAHEHAARECN